MPLALLYSRGRNNKGGKGMKNLGFLIVVLSLIGTVPCFAKTGPSVSEQTVGNAEKPCDCQKSGKPQKISKTPSGTLAGQGQKPEEATGAKGSRAGEQIQKEEDKK